MSLYDITILPDSETEEYKVTLRGPGIEADGRRYIFANTYRCSAFAEAVNFAYQQGLRDGAARKTEDRMYVVTGTTPENMSLRTETWFDRLRRRFLF